MVWTQWAGTLAARVLLVVTMVWVGTQATAATLLHVGGPSYQELGIGMGNGQQAAAIGFSTQNDLTEITFYVPLSNSSSIRASNVRVFLTDRIGPGTTQDNVLAENTLVLGTGLEPTLFDVMQRPTLAAGTYFLVMAATDGSSAGWSYIWNSNAVVTTAPGVTLLHSYSYAQEGNSGFPPAYEPNGDSRDGTIFGGIYAINIQGNVAPEPGSLALLVGMGLMALGRRRAAA